MERLREANRLIVVGNTLRYVRYLDDFGAYPLSNFWLDTGVAGFAGSKDYERFSLRESQWHIPCYLALHIRRSPLYSP